METATYRQAWTITVQALYLYPLMYPGQLSLPSLQGRLIEYRPAWLGLRRGAFSCVGWQVTLCDLIWQVTLRSIGKPTPVGLLFNW